MQTFSYHAPTKVLFGEGASDQIGSVVSNYGRNVAVIAGKTAGKSGLLTRILERLTAAGLKTAVFDNIEPNPTADSVDAGGEFARKHKADVILGVGGGSSIDAAKGIAITAVGGETIWDYVIGGKKAGASEMSSSLPVVIVSTTAGTGSEVTPGAVISNKRTQTKEVVVSPWIFPRAAIVDPSLTVTMSPALTAHTGIDALAQSIEGFVSVNSNPISDILALQSMVLISEALRSAVANGKDLQARSMMSLGATLSGMVIAQAGVGAAHALSLPLSARFGVGHGLAVAMVLAEVMAQNLAANPGKFAQIADALGSNVRNLLRDQAAEAAVRAVRQLVKDAGITQRLTDIGVAQGDLRRLAMEAQNPDLACNPRKLAEEDLYGIYRRVL